MQVDPKDLLVALGVAAIAWALIFATLAGELRTDLPPGTAKARSRTMAKAGWLFLVAATMLLVAAAALA